MPICLTVPTEIKRFIIVYWTNSPVPEHAPHYQTPSSSRPPFLHFNAASAHTRCPRKGVIKQGYQGISALERDAPQGPRAPTSSFALSQADDLVLRHHKCPGGFRLHLSHLIAVGISLSLIECEWPSAASAKNEKCVSSQPAEGCIVSV